MHNINNVCGNCPTEAFLHSKVEGLQGDEPGHDVHGDVQVLHCRKTITDIHCEAVIALKDTNV